jgi:hypothetical protein
MTRATEEVIFSTNRPAPYGRGLSPTKGTLVDSSEEGRHALIALGGSEKGGSSMEVAVVMNCHHEVDSLSLRRIAKEDE